MEETELLDNLATRYRPTKLGDLIGQVGVVEQMRGFIKKKSFPNAILITGNSGTGKTTTANMIVRYLNCAQLNEKGDPCGKCDSCLKSKHPDLLEVNVGNTRGIDDMRAIINSSAFQPKFKRRVILLDEAHQFTKQAESALLIPLENKKNKTVFVLATTNPEKVLPTIVGRCTRFELRPVDEELIAKRLYVIAKKEGYNFNNLEKGVEAVEYIAASSNGQVRDALQMLGSVLAVLEGGATSDVYEIASKYVGSKEQDLEIAAGNLIAYTVGRNLKSALRVILKADNPRGLLSKCRWLIYNLLDVYAFEAEYDQKLKETKKGRFVSRPEKVYKKIIAANNYNSKPFELITISYALAQAEVIMNSASIDEIQILMSTLGDIIYNLRKMQL